MAVPCRSIRGRKRTVVRRPRRKRSRTLRSRSITGTKSAPAKNPTFHPTIAPQPKPGRRRRLYHRTHRVQEHPIQHRTAPRRRFITVYLPARITFDLTVGRSSQAPKKDRLGLLYPYMASDRPIPQSPPGGWGRNRRNLPPEGQGRPARRRRQAWDGTAAKLPLSFASGSCHITITVVGTRLPDYRLVGRCFGLSASRLA